MKKVTTLLLLIMSCSLFASEDMEKIKVKDIKEYVQTINPDSTCLDEYLKRRTQLIVKLSASPVIIAASTAGSFVAGGAAGAGISVLAQADGWSALGYVIGGAMLGTVAGVAAGGTDTALTAINLRNTNLVIQALASRKMNLPSEKVERLYSKYLKKSSKDLSYEDFQEELMRMDEEGVLCDGSLVKQPKIKIGPKLQFKIPKLKQLILAMDLRE
jgi:hypothetical protein